MISVSFKSARELTDLVTCKSVASGTAQFRLKLAELMTEKSKYDGAILKKENQGFQFIITQTIEW